MSLKLGLIGTGRIGADHARTIATLDNVSELIVADANPASAAAIAKELGARQVDLEQVIAESDAVVVTTPTSTHAEYIEAACRAGVPVFTEKPVALDIRTTKRVIQVVEETGTLTQVGFMLRFDAGYMNAKKLLNQGAIGTLRRVHLVTGDYPPPGAGFIPKSGGIFKDCTIHDIDALRWVTGHQVNEVYAIGSAVGAPYFAANGDADEAVGTMTMDDGTFVTFQVSRNNGAGYDIRMELAGEKDTLSVGFDSYLALTSAEPEFNFSEAGERYPNFYPRFTKAYQSEIAQFVDAVAAGAPSPAPIQDALEALFVCEALNVSRVEHRPVRVDEIRSANGVMRPEQY